MHTRPCVYSPSKCQCRIVVSEFDYLQVSGCLSLMGKSKPKVTGLSHLTAQTFLRKQLSTQHKTHLFRPRLDLSLCAPFPEKGRQCCLFFLPSSPQMSLRTQAPAVLPRPRVVSAGPKKDPKTSAQVLL